jgi:hypothetical protein
MNMKKAKNMRCGKMITVAAAALLASSVGQAYSQSENEVVLYESLSSTFSDYLLTLASSSEIQEEDAVNLIHLFEDAIQVWSHPPYRRYAREAVVSLNNVREYWIGSLEACDDMIAETDDPGVLFDFQYDRWTVLQRLDGSFRQAEGNLSITVARDTTIDTFLKMYSRIAEQSKNAPCDSFRLLGMQSMTHCSKIG